MLSIKIKIGFDKERTKKKEEPDIKKAVFFTALFDSVVWIADTVLLLKFFYAVPLYPFGMFFICGIFMLYLAYCFIKTRLLMKKYGKEVYREEFGHTGLLLAAASAALWLFLIVMSYV